MPRKRGVERPRPSPPPPPPLTAAARASNLRYRANFAIYFKERPHAPPANGSSFRPRPRAGLLGIGADSTAGDKGEDHRNESGNLDGRSGGTFRRRHAQRVGAAAGRLRERPL